MATWFQGPKEDFIRVSQEGAARGVNILHFTGGCRITLSGSRAIAQTRMTIMQRGRVDGVLCDVTCTGRFYDFFGKQQQRALVVSSRAACMSMTPLRLATESLSGPGVYDWRPRAC
jgi:hypothetical protein